MNKRTRIFLIILFLIICLGLISSKTMARLARESGIDYTATTGDMICEYEIDQNENYKENEVKYFLVNVRNYRNEADGSSKITDVDVNYSLTIQNKAGSNGVYKWVRIDNNEMSANYSSAVTTNKYSFTTGSKQTATFKVYVQLDSSQNIEQNVEIDVGINAEQIEKKTTFGSEDA